MRRAVAGLVVVVWLTVAAGCISLGGKGAPPLTAVHAVDVADLPPVKLPPSSAELAVRSFGARRRFDDRVVRREPDGTVALLEMERWAESPADAATDVVREALTASGAFARVFDATEGFLPTRTLDAYVLAFDLVRPESGPWRASFRVRFDLGDAKTGAMLAHGTYEGGADLPDASSKGLGPAMGRAIGKALGSALADWFAKGVLR